MKTYRQLFLENIYVFKADLSFAWNVHKNNFGKSSKVYKDADLFANKIAAENPALNFSVYAVVTLIGRSGHSKSEVLLLAIPSQYDDKFDSYNRIYKKLFTVN